MQRDPIIAIRALLREYIIFLLHFLQNFSTMYFKLLVLLFTEQSYEHSQFTYSLHFIL